MCRCWWWRWRWSSGAAAPGAAQAGFEWRLGVGAGVADIGSTGPHQDPGGTPATYQVALERAVGSRFGVGLEWMGTWYTGPEWGRQQRQAWTLTGSFYPVGRLSLMAGAGPGLASWVEVIGPPSGGMGDVLIDVYEGEPALALSAGAAVDVPAGPFQLAPLTRVVVHRLRGESLTLAFVALRLSLRSGR